MNILSIPWTRLSVGFLVFLLSCKPGTRIQQDPGGTEILRDKLGQFYELADDSTVRKYGKNGQLQYEYRDQDLLSNPSIDVRDPYKISLFYQGQQKLVLLDNTLNPLSVMDLSGLEDAYISLVCRSEDGNFWLFDANGQKLILVDENLLALRESFPLYQEGIGAFTPRFMDVGLESILLGDPDSGILLFDHLGNFRRQFRIQGFLEVRLIGERIILVREEGVFAYDPIHFEPIRLVDSPELFRGFYTMDPSTGKWIALEKDEQNRLSVVGDRN
jgi:hypothetical protein